MAMNKPVAVIKVGGDMLLNQADRDGFASNLKDLTNAGWNCVVLHGGGPQLNTLQQLYGLVPTKIDGRRVTREADLLVVKQALCGEVNVDLVASLVAANVNAFGCHGASGLLVQASKRPPMAFADHGVVDMGEVGDINQINVALLRGLLALDLVPVIASLGVDEHGRIFNINADTTVSAIARALNADVLILSTMVGGIFKDINDKQSRISELTPNTAAELISKRVITDGMIPKVQEALALLEHGVGSIVIANAAVKGGFLAISKGDNSIGTRLIRDI
ncbi:MAG: acetylglutamate kinase [Arenicella sp.]|jgi:acetylglutamate kinase